MARAALTFFILALVAFLFGATGLAGMSMEIGRILIATFILLAIISFAVYMFTGKKTNIIP